MILIQMCEPQNISIKYKNYKLFEMNNLITFTQYCFVIYRNGIIYI